MTKKLSMLAVAFVFGLLVTAISGQAQAAATTCDGGIEYIDFLPLSSSNNEFHFGCRAANGTVQGMFSHTNSGSCTQYNRNLDTVKFWYSMVSGWALSSKKVQVYYESCGGINRITAISLRRQ